MSVVNDIKRLKIQGAVNIAEAGLKHLKKYINKSNFNKEAGKLIKARPTAVPLFNAINEVKKDRTKKKIDELLTLIKTSKKKIARQRLFKKKVTVMTHCHSSEVVALLKKNKSKIKKVYVTETRPRNQGLLTLKDLRGIRVVFIVDSACGYYMKDTDAVLVGSDALRKEGNVNKIGTLPLAITASAFNKPFYVVASKLKIDKRKKIEIEMRDPKEVSKIKTKILNPAFDITPWRYVTAIITEDGIKKPAQLVRK